MTREIIQDGDWRLKAPNKLVENFDDSNLKKAVDDLIDSMRANGLIGIAAPQIGENLQVFVTEPRKTETRNGSQVDELRIYINPKITHFSDEKVVIWEGCGSYKRAQIFGPVNRSKEIVVEASGLDGKRFSFACDGILARVIQHEYDHLNGMEFVDRMENINDLRDRDYYIKNIKDRLETIEASIITKKELKELEGYN